MFKRKKKFILLSLFVLILMLVFLSSCGKAKVEIKQEKENTAFRENISSKELISNNSSDEVLAAIINEPSKKEIDNARRIKYLTLDEGGSSIFIIPTYNGSDVKISKIEFDGTDFEKKGTVFEQEDTEDGFAILCEVFRPEGIPRHMVTVEYKDKRAKYLISYNGKDGNEPIEFILSSE